MEDVQEQGSETLRRRGVILGGLGALAAVALGRPSSARGAASEGGGAAIVGADNREQTTTSFSIGSGTALAGITDDDGINPAIGVLGTAGASVNDVSNPRGIRAGMWGFGKRAVGVWGQSLGMAGVLGISDKIGVLGISGDYGDAPKMEGLQAGAWNYSRDYVGGWNSSKNGIGLVATSGDPYSSAEVSRLDPAGLHAAASGGTPAACFQSDRAPAGVGMSAHHIGLIGVAGKAYAEADLLALDSAGVHAAADGTTPAFCAASDAAPAAIGMSKSHIGVIGVAGRAYAEADLLALDSAGVHAAADGTTPAFCAASDAGPAAIGMSKSHIGVVGATGGVYTEAEIAGLDSAGVHAAAKGPATALCSAAETGVAVLAMSTGSAVVGMVGAYTEAAEDALKAEATSAVRGSGHEAIGVWGSSDSKVGVLAESTHGVAFRARGPMQATAAGNSMIKKKSDSQFVQYRETDAKSHVSVTLTSNPNGKGDDGNSMSFWIERQPGKGFVIHLSDKAKMDISFSYFIIGPSD